MEKWSGFALFLYHDCNVISLQCKSKAVVAYTTLFTVYLQACLNGWRDTSSVRSCSVLIQSHFKLPPLASLTMKRELSE